VEERGHVYCGCGSAAEREPVVGESQLVAHKGVLRQIYGKDA